MDKRKKYIILEKNRRNTINIKIQELKNKIPYQNLSTKEQILNGVIRYINENEDLKNIINNMEYEYSKLQMKFFEIEYNTILN